MESLHWRLLVPGKTPTWMEKASGAGADADIARVNIAPQMLALAHALGTLDPEEK